MIARKGESPHFSEAINRSDSRLGPVPRKIAIVAGETSGDLLAGNLIEHLKAEHPEWEFFGIGGPLMRAQGCRCLYSMDEISVMGLDQLLGRLPHILALRRRLRALIVEQKPAAFIGVDVPDFNLGLEVALRKSGIPCIHYVSPTVWAWRGYRIGKIARAVDRMLTLFPFEAEFYRRHRVPVSYVGHPLANEISAMESAESSRNMLKIDPGLKLVAVLPGSRSSEIEQLMPVFLDTIKILSREFPEVHWVVPAVNAAMYEKITAMWHQHAPEVLLDLRLGQSRKILNAADIALLASGTAALEAALLVTPMVVAYKVSAVTALLVRLTHTVDYFSMPNHLTERPVVPEFLQSQANPQRLGCALRTLLLESQARERQIQAFSSLPALMQQPTTRLAADAVREVIQGALP